MSFPAAPPSRSHSRPKVKSLFLRLQRSHHSRPQFAWPVTGGVRSYVAPAAWVRQLVTRFARYVRSFLWAARFWFAAGRKQVRRPVLLSGCRLVFVVLVRGDELGPELVAGRRGFHHLLQQLFELLFSHLRGIGFV